MDTNSWNTLQNSFICIPQKKVSHSYGKTWGWEIILCFFVFHSFRLMTLFEFVQTTQWLWVLHITIGYFALVYVHTNKQHNIIKLSRDWLQSIFMFPSTYFNAHFGMSHKKKNAGWKRQDAHKLKKIHIKTVCAHFSRMRRRKNAHKLW